MKFWTDNIDECFDIKLSDDDKKRTKEMERSDCSFGDVLLYICAKYNCVKYNGKYIALYKCNPVGDPIIEQICSGTDVPKDHDYDNSVRILYMNREYKTAADIDMGTVFIRNCIPIYSSHLTIRYQNSLRVIGIMYATIYNMRQWKYVNDSADTCAIRYIMRKWGSIRDPTKVYFYTEEQKKEIIEILNEDISMHDRYDHLREDNDDNDEFLMEDFIDEDY